MRTKSSFKNSQVAVIGCGKIGQKRAEGLGDHVKVFGCYDICPYSSEAFSKRFSCEKFDHPQLLINSTQIDTVIICVQHDMLCEYAVSAIKAGKNVLVEKPAAIKSAELDILINELKKTNVYFDVGFNHRFHPAVVKAFELIAAGELGELMFTRSRYGHGGRLGYESEWRADFKKSGGGELIDQGPHLIDLNLQIFGELELKYGLATTLFWDMEVDDNAFLLLQNSLGQCAQIHVSCTEWKNMFSMEIYGKAGKLEIFGLGGSYGPERLTFYKMLPQMGPPETTTWEFPWPDTSFTTETAHFFDQVHSGCGDALANAINAQKILKIIEKTYGN